MKESKKSKSLLLFLDSVSTQTSYHPLSYQRLHRTDFYNNYTPIINNFKKVSFLACDAYAHLEKLSKVIFRL